MDTENINRYGYEVTGKPQNKTEWKRKYYISLKLMVREDQRLKYVRTQKKKQFGNHICKVGPLVNSLTIIYLHHALPHNEAGQSTETKKAKVDLKMEWVTSWIQGVWGIIQELERVLWYIYRKKEEWRNGVYKGSNCQDQDPT